MAKQLTDMELLTYAHKRGIPIRKTYDSNGNLQRELLFARIMDWKRARYSQLGLWVAIAGLLLTLVRIHG